MPRLKAEVTTRTEVDLSASLQKQLKLELHAYQKLVAERKALDLKIAEKKTAMEMLFSDADEYSALVEGVRVTTPWGDVPMKIVKGISAGRLNMKKLMTEFKLTPKDVESCRDKGKPKKEYLGIWLPTDKDDADEGDDE